MIISLIAAVAHDRVLGFEGQMPWHLPADLQHFKKMTLNKPIIMGRKTFASLGKPLPQRHNIVLTRDQKWHVPDISIAHSVEEALHFTGDAPEVMIIGGAELYKLFLPCAHRIYLTEIDHTFQGDTFFPIIDRAEWRVVSHESFQPDEKNSYAYKFLTLVREGT